jgi:cytochrome c5
MKSALLPFLIALTLVACKPQDPAPLPPQVGTRSVPEQPPATAPAAAAPDAAAIDPAAALAATTADAPASATVAVVDGEAVYKKACITCHGTGLAGAPKLGDAADWGPRIAQGDALLLEHATKGYTGKKGMMPPKGGFVTLTDDEISAAIGFMTSAPAQ